MLNIAQEAVDQNRVVLHLEGSLDIETVNDLREALLKVFAESGEQIQIDGNLLENVDFYGLQLLCSAHRTAVTRKKVLTWKNGRPNHLNEIMQISGFNRHCGCSLCPPDQDCMWL